jgi:hypothetical protein
MKLLEGSVLKDKKFERSKLIGEGGYAGVYGGGEFKGKGVDMRKI